MKNTMFEAVRSSLGGTPSRRQALTALAAGLPGLFLTAGALETTAKKRKKNQRKRQRRKNRLPDKDPQPDTEACDVCRSGCAFSSVQAAIDAAAPGDTLRLCEGVFEERILIQKDLTLIGAGDDESGTTLDASGDGTTVAVFRATATLESLLITGGAAGFSGGGIHSDRSKLTLKECTVSGNAAPLGGGGIFVETGGEQSELILNDSTVVDNESEQGAGIANRGGVVTLNRSRVQGNAASQQGGGIFNFLDGTVTLNDSAVVGNTPDNCVGVDGCG